MFRERDHQAEPVICTCKFWMESLAHTSTKRCVCSAARSQAKLLVDCRLLKRVSQAAIVLLRTSAR